MSARRASALLLAFALVLAVASTACSGPGASSPCAASADRRTAPADLLAVDAEFSRTSVARGAPSAFDAYLADDAVELPDGEDPQKGRAAIVDSMRVDFAKGNLTLQWTPVAADVSRDGELGYTYGTYELLVKKPDGTTESHRGKYTTVWKRGADGRWRAVLDMGNRGPAPKRP